MTHAVLVEAGKSWIRRIGFPIVASELMTHVTPEIPDIVGYRSTSSIVIEVKVSRSDFRRDARKAHRSAGGLGLYRFYLCPAGVIDPSELPERWGLLYAEGRSIALVRGPRGNLWPSYGAASAGLSSYDEWLSWQHPVDMIKEIGVLCSIARRTERFAKAARERLSQMQLSDGVANAK